MTKAERAAAHVGLFVVFFALALVVSGILVEAVGGSATKVLDALIDGSVRSPGAWGRSLDESAPLALVALGVVIAFKSGLYNIGQEGQVAIGALAATLVILQTPGPGWLLIALGLLAAAAGGGLWAGLAAGAYYGRRVDVLITTLLLTFVAPNLILFLVSGSNSRRASQSEQLPADSRLPHIDVFGNTFHVGTIIALGVTIVVSYALVRTIWGLHVRTLGLNPRTAQRFGVNPARVGGSALVLSGALAGLAGGVFLVGSAFRLQDQISNDFGWEGLLVALVARLNAVAVLPVSFFFGMLRRGGSFLRATGVSATITGVIQSLFVVAALLPAAVMKVWDRRQERSAARAATEGANRDR
jgi:simple sugar transport system permease protein